MHVSPPKAVQPIASGLTHCTRHGRGTSPFSSPHAGYSCNNYHNNFFCSFVGILFVDALQRMFRVQAESDLGKNGRGQGSPDIRTETTIAARKF